MRRPLAVLAPVLAAGAAMPPSLGGADPGLPTVAPHRHDIVVGSGASTQFVAEVGPDLCANPDHAGLRKAFSQFHNNLHRMEPGAIGQLAPGLHDQQHTEQVPRGCTFVPPN